MHQTARWAPCACFVVRWGFLLEQSRPGARPGRVCDRKCGTVCKIMEETDMAEKINKYEAIAPQILELVGGKDNIRSFAH